MTVKRTFLSLKEASGPPLSRGQARVGGNVQTNNFQGKVSG